MASRGLGTLSISLVAEVAGFVQGMDKSQRAAEKWKKQVGEDLKTIQSAAKTGFAAVGAAAVSGAAALTAITVQTAAAAREIKNLSAVAGTNTTAFQEAAYGASLFGIQQEKLADIFKDTQDKIGDFIQTGGGAMADFFENIAPRVGITADAFRDLSGRDALQLYYNTLQDANLSQSEMTFYMEAIASDSAMLQPLLKDNGKAFKELGEEAHDAGVVLDNMDLAALETAQRTVDEIGAAWRGFTNILAVEFSPVLAGIGNMFLDVDRNMDDVSEGAETMANVIVSGVGFAADSVDGLRRTVLVAGSAVAIFGLGAKDVMLTVAKAVIDFPTQAVNGLITMLNTLPGIDIGEFGQGDLSKKIEAEIQNVRTAVNIGWDDVHNILMEPMPSEGIKRFVAEARAEIKKLGGEMSAITGVDPSGAELDKRRDTIIRSLESERDEAIRIAKQQKAEAIRIAKEQEAEIEFLRGKGKLSAGQANEFLIANEQQKADRLREINEKLLKDHGGYWEKWTYAARKNLLNFDELSNSVIGNFTAGFGNAVEEMVFDAQSLDDALKGIAESIMRGVVNALGQMAAQWIALQAVQAVMSAASTAQSVAEASTVAAAWAPAAAGASLATVGGNAGPAIAGITAASAVAASSLTGMAHDGIDSVPKTGTWLLEKGERVMTSETSKKLDQKLDGGSGVVVNLYEDASKAGQVQQGQRDDGTTEVNVFVSDIMSNGPRAKAMQRAYGLRRQGA